MSDPYSLERSYALTTPGDLPDEHFTEPATLDEMVDTGAYLNEDDLLSIQPSIQPTQPIERVIALPVSSSAGSTSSKRSKRVLIIDDDLAARLYMRARLMLRGNVEVIEASGGHQALEVLQTQHFDIVLLDVDMQALNGYEVCRAIRKLCREQLVVPPKIFMITSRNSTLDKIRAKMAGADAFLSKPPHPGQLAKLLDPT